MLLRSQKPVQFGEFEIDCTRWQLTWRDETIPLNRKTFDLLLYLVDHRERVVAKEELIQALWPEQFIEESNLTQHIFLLRKGFARHASGHKFIETVPGRGYRFTAPVLEPQLDATEVTISVSESTTRILFEEEQEDKQDATKAHVATWVVGKKFRVALAAALVAVCSSVIGGGWLLWQHWLDQTAGQPVAIVLTPLDGTTGDTILDSALVDGLRIDIAQSPFVSLVSPARVHATLLEMHRQAEPLTASLAREVCERTNSQVMLRGNIARTGQHFFLTEGSGELCRRHSSRPVQAGSGFCRSIASRH